MSIKLIDDTKLSAIGNAIRTKGGTASLIDIDDMPQAIADLPSGGGGGFDWSQIDQCIRIVTYDDTTPDLVLTGIDMSGFTTAQYMFQECYKETIDFTGVDLSNIQIMSYMFANNETVANILGFEDMDTSHVQEMGNMFSSCRALENIDTSSLTLDTSTGTSASKVFYECESLTHLDLGSFDTSTCVSMSYMFSGCSSLTSLNLASFDTASAGAPSSMSRIFQGCSSLVDIIWSQKPTVQPITASPIGNANITSRMKFYVPDDLVDAYKASNWSPYASQIYSINDLPASVAALYAGHY